MERSRFFYEGVVPCPACGRDLKTGPSNAHVSGSHFHLERPAGQLEAICGEQHGTEHHVPIRWTPAPTPEAWEVAKNSPMERSPITVGIVILSLAFVALAVLTLLDATK